MKNVHFKRHGFASWLEMNIDNFHVDLRGNVLIVSEEYKEVEVWQDKEYTVSKSRNILSKTYELFDYSLIENDLNQLLPFEIKLEKFIESYGIQLKKDEINKNDIDMLDGKEISVDMTLKEYPAAIETLSKWYAKISQEMINTLNSNAMNMKIKDIFVFIHDNNYKADFESRFNEMFA